MNKIATEIQALYYLNLSKEDEVLENMIRSKGVFEYMLEIYLVSPNLNAKQTTKKIAKLIKKRI